MQNAVQEQLEAAKEARQGVATASTEAQAIVDTAIEAARVADRAVTDALVGKDIIVLRGRTTHQYVPLGPNVQKANRWIYRVANVEAVRYDTSQNPPVDEMLLRYCADDSKWIMPVQGTLIEFATADTPRDGSYFCNTQGCKRIVSLEEVRDHMHGCPMEETMCSSRECNVMGACQA